MLTIKVCQSLYIMFDPSPPSYKPLDAATPPLPNWKAMGAKERKSSVNKKKREELELGLAGLRPRPTYTELGRWLTATEGSLNSRNHRDCDWSLCPDVCFWET